MVRVRFWLILLTLPFSPARGCESPANPLTFHKGGIEFHPSGFFETIAMYRTAVTGDSVSTRFGAIPTANSPSEFLVSAAHSRTQICAQWGNWTGYVESDFLNAVGKTPYRFRQYWGAYRFGKWQILAGQAWSLLRPNREGISSETGLMNTLAVEPAYHVGLAGLRNRQVRITRDGETWHFAVSYEAGRNFLAKVSHEAHRVHLEATGLAAVHRRGA